MTDEFAVPTVGAGPAGITLGQDGNLWFTEPEANNVARITTTGTITEFPIPTAGSSTGSIAPGTDGHLWASEQTGDQLARGQLPGSPWTVDRVGHIYAADRDRGRHVR